MSLDVEAIEDLPPELTGALTFHLPLEVAALQLAGAAEEVIAERIARRMAEAYAAGLVDPPLYRWAVEHYRDAAAGLTSADPARRAAAFNDVLPLGDGLAGAAFHGLIRLGYGLWRNRADEVARGLAYLRTRRQVLVADHGAAGRRRAGTDEPLPSAEDLAGATVFDLMNLAAGIEDRGALLPHGDAPLTIDRLAAASLALVGRNPSSFVAVHTLTGLHGLCEVHLAVVGRPDGQAPVEQSALGPWWRSFAIGIGAASVVMAQYGPEALPAALAPTEDRDELLAAAVASGETHDVKLVLALCRLHDLGVVELDEVRRVGALKLASTECSA